MSPFQSRLSLLSSSSISNLRSPTTSSPLSKQLRRERTSGIKIVDVCSYVPKLIDFIEFESNNTLFSSPVQWNIFIQSSRSWNSVGISIGTRIKAKSGEEVIGEKNKVALFSPNNDIF